MKTVDITRLKRYREDPARDAQEMAASEECEYAVESILDHWRENPGKKGLKFLVRWKGYSQEDDTWEPYSVVKDLEVLEKYLSDHPELRL